MKRQKSTKRALTTSAISLLVCISLLLGTTFAWFTDSVISATNIIAAGNLKIDMQWAESYDGANTQWKDAAGADAIPVFDYDLWEPGYTVVRYIKVSNEGNLAFKYLMHMMPTGRVDDLAQVIDVRYDIVSGNSAFIEPSADNTRGSLTDVGTLEQVIDTSKTVVSGVLLPESEVKEGYYSGEVVVCVALHMKESAGNEYQNKSIGDAFTIRLTATQYDYEEDAFGNRYDVLADLSLYATQSKTLASGAQAVNFSVMHKNTVVATLQVPADAIADKTRPVTVTIDGIDPSETIVVGDNIKSFAYDINVSNLKENLSGEQLITVVLTVPVALPAVQTYHKGELVEGAVYDEVAGTITFKTASFSPYAISYKEYEVYTVAQLREYATIDDANIKLMQTLQVNLDPTAANNDCDAAHFCKLTGSYEYYNVVNVKGKNIALDLNGYSIVVSGDKDGDTVGAVFFIMPNSNLNITDSKGGGMIKAADPCYVVWAPYDAEYGLSYVDVYGGIFAAHSYAGDMRTPGYFAMFYAGEGGLMDIRGGYFLYDNESYTDINGTMYENVNNGAFNVMNSATTPCITIHDGVMLINQHYRQNGNNQNNKDADHDSIFLAEHCSLVKVSKTVTIDGKQYSTWYQVQTNYPTRFETVFKNTDRYTYRVGNLNTVTLGSLFTTDNVIADAASITVTVSGNNVSAIYTPNTSDWSKGTLEFFGTGLARININGYVLTVEVVEALNATAVISATENDVVLLNDGGFNTLTVSGGHTLYGNGFTLTRGSDSAALDTGYSFVTVTNGTLDNVQIVCPNFDHAVLYKKNMSESGNRYEVDGSKTRYYNVQSGVAVSGNSRILNSRISGGRAALNITGGNVVVENSQLERGAVASLLVGAANKVTLRDVTLMQKPTASTYDSSKILMGFSALIMCDANGDAAPVTLEGTLVQYAWVSSAEKGYVPDDGESIISTVLGKTAYLHDINGDNTNESLNLGFAYLPADVGSPVNGTSITDNRTDKASIAYDYVQVPITAYGVTIGNTYVYSYSNSNGTAAAFKQEPVYRPNKQSDIIAVKYDDAADGLVQDRSFGSDSWVYELNVDLDKIPGYALDFSKLTMLVNGETVPSFTVNGSAKPAAPVMVTAGGVTYTLAATIDGKVYTVDYKVTGTETSKESPTLVSANYAAGVCVASSYGGTWSGAAPALKGIQIKYWSVAEKQYKTINLADYTPTSTGKLNGTGNTWTYSPANGDFTLTLTGGQVHSGNKVNAMPVVVNWDSTNTLFFVAATSSGLVNSGNSARSVPVSYTFTDNNGGTSLTFSNTWSVAENQNAQYNYNDFCSGKQTKLEKSTNPCVTPDTLIMLADGTQKRIDQVTYADRLLVWNFYTGAYEAASPAILFDHGYSENTVIGLTFNDGTALEIVTLHQLFDLDLNRFVTIDASNVAQYVGHRFAKQAGDGYEAVVLCDYTVEQRYEGAYGIISGLHYNIITAGMITTDFMHADYDLFNYFEVGVGMVFDRQQMQADIDQYGLYTYEEFAQYMTYEQFVGFNVQYMKVAVGKGTYTYEGILALIDSYLR